MPDSGILDAYGAPFANRLAEQTERIVERVVETIARKAPELVGPGPLPAELLARRSINLLQTVGAAISCRASLENPLVPPTAVEYARVLAQRGVTADGILLAHSAAWSVIERELIECAATVVNDRHDLIRTVEAVVAYGQAYNDALLRAELAVHNPALTAWQHNRFAGLKHRVDAVLGGTVTDAELAEHMLGYPVSGHHVALMIWQDGEAGSGLNPIDADRHLRALPAVQKALVVPRDERTLLCWLNTPHIAPVDEWIKDGVLPRDTHRIALGEPGVGIEGFGLSHRQARAAGLVLFLARRELGSTVRYRDVSAISFLVDQPVESRAWVRATLGDLAGTGEEREALRRTLQVYLEEGENIAATARRLFVHRNTVKYRIERAREMLPQPLEGQRLDTALALRYFEWLPGVDRGKLGNDRVPRSPPSPTANAATRALRD